MQDFIKMVTRGYSSANNVLYNELKTLSNVESDTLLKEMCHSMVLMCVTVWYKFVSHCGRNAKRPLCAFKSNSHI